MYDRHTMILKKAFAVAAFVLLALTFSNVRAFAEGTVDIEVTGTYGQTEARTMLRMVNDFRTGRYIDGGMSDVWAYDESGSVDTESYRNLGELQYDYELEKVAMQRAMECALQFSHTRPTYANDSYDKSCYELYPDGYTAKGENIAAGFHGNRSKAENAFDAWSETEDRYEGQGHRRNMLGRGYNRIGIGHVVIHWEGELTEGSRDYSTSEDIHFWVQEFGYRTDSFGLTQTAASDKEESRTVSVLESNIDRKAIEVFKKDVEISYGDTYTFKDATAALRLKGTWPRKISLSWTDGPVSEGTYMVPFKSNLTMSSGNSAVASVAGIDVIKGNNAGNTVFMITSDAAGTESAQFNVRVVPVTISGALVSVSDRLFTGEPLTPEPVVVLGGRTLVKDVDYKLSYSNNVNAGSSAKVTISGIGNYKDSAEKTFIINPKPLTDAAVNVATNDLTYSGSLQRPVLTIKDGEKQLVVDTDYSLQMGDSVNCGTYDITVAGKGNYAGTRKTTYRIVSKNIGDNDIIVEAIADQIQSGKELKPSLTIKHGSRTLSADDYTAVYSDNVKIGTATVRISGKGNYEGSRTATFKIAAKAADNKAARAAQKGSDGTKLGAGASAEAANNAITKFSGDEGPKGSKYAKLALRSVSQGKANIKLTWNQPKGAVKYVIYGNACGKKNKMKKLGTVKGKSKTYNVKKIANKKLKKGTYHKFMIVALDKKNNVISSSKVIHVATKGGKVGNPTKLTVTAKLDKNGKALKKYKATTAIKLKKGKTTVIKTSVKTDKKLKLKKHRAVCFETSNAKIATVDSKGKIKAKKKGTCYIYAYAQNGLYKRIKITVR